MSQLVNPSVVASTERRIFKVTRERADKRTLYSGGDSFPRNATRFTNFSLVFSSIHPSLSAVHSFLGKERLVE